MGYVVVHISVYIVACVLTNSVVYANASADTSYVMAVAGRRRSPAASMRKSWSSPVTRSGFFATASLRVLAFSRSGNGLVVSWYGCKGTSAWRTVWHCTSTSVRPTVYQNWALATDIDALRHSLGDSFDRHRQHRRSEMSFFLDLWREECPLAPWTWSSSWRISRTIAARLSNFPSSTLWLGTHAQPAFSSSGSMTKLSKTLSRNVLWQPPSASHRHFPWPGALTQPKYIFFLVWARCASVNNAVKHLYCAGHPSTMSMIICNSSSFSSCLEKMSSSIMLVLANVVAAICFFSSDRQQ
ncbi:hypothetical protein ACHAXT_002587 [Thalassiosira profunda]